MIFFWLPIPIISNVLIIITIGIAIFMIVKYKKNKFNADRLTYVLYNITIMILRRVKIK